ncbi:MAG: hypothetical protein QOH23_957 [Gaiellaceae bacterium]|nr:hypothetical protein [Gaiellaceae bacterium]
MHVGRMLAIGAVVLVGARGAGAAAPSSFHLVFDGKHNAALLHEGTFTTSSSWCRSGTAADTAIDEATLTATRLFRCTEGGDFTASVSPLSAEHGGIGSWQIVAGSGALADLRGKGNFTSTRLSGGADPATITFRSTWDGPADFDAVPPAVALTRSSVRKLTRPKNTYSVRLVLSLTDASGGPVSFVLQLVDPSHPATTFAYKLGKTASGSVTKTIKIKPKKTRRIRIDLEASDQLGNTSSFAKVISLR